MKILLKNFARTQGIEDRNDNILHCLLSHNMKQDQEGSDLAEKFCEAADM